MTNFLSQPTIEAIQTLLVIGNVLSYNMNPGISYVLLGMTLRMGLALGLHVESSRFSADERYRRRHVWYDFDQSALHLPRNTNTFLPGGPWPGKIAISPCPTIVLLPQLSVSPI
jgi:hypothetical protein